VAGVSAVVVLSASRTSPEPGARRRLAALEQTSLTVTGGEPLSVPALVDADGAVFTPERLQGRWSLVFFGYTSCTDVCPMTLQALSVAARDPRTGIATGASQIVFVSLDPERDTPPRMKSYLQRFDAPIVGLTGRRDALDRFRNDVGAGFRSRASGIDHSTSLFVLDPHGRLARVLLRPTDPARIVADLDAVRTADGATRSADGAGTHVSRAR